MEYSVLTPIAPHKLYARELYWDGVDSLTQSPTQIFFHSKKEIHDNWMSGRNDANVIWDKEADNAKTRIVPGTTAARESLRRAFLERGQAEWALWLDCDIIPPPDMIDKFEALKETHPHLVMLVAYHPSRVDFSRIRHGISCTFAHRDAMMAYPFTLATIRGQHLGDDQIWLHVIKQFSRRKDIEVLFGLYFDVKHAHEDGRVKEFEDAERGALLLR